MGKLREKVFGFLGEGKVFKVNYEMGKSMCGFNYWRY